MTRARDQLTLIQPLRFYVRGHAIGSDRHVYASRSRFIQNQDLPAFDLVGPAPGGSSGVGVAPKPFTVDLKAAIRGMWK